MEPTAPDHMMTTEPSSVGLVAPLAPLGDHGLQDEVPYPSTTTSAEPSSVGLVAPISPLGDHGHQQQLAPAPYTAPSAIPPVQPSYVPPVQQQQTTQLQKAPMMQQQPVAPVQQYAPRYDQAPQPNRHSQHIEMQQQPQQQQFGSYPGQPSRNSVQFGQPQPETFGMVGSRFPQPGPKQETPKSMFSAAGVCIAVVVYSLGIVFGLISIVFSLISLGSPMKFTWGSKTKKVDMKSNAEFYVGLALSIIQLVCMLSAVVSGLISMFSKKAAFARLFTMDAIGICLLVQFSAITIFIIRLAYGIFQWYFIVGMFVLSMCCGIIFCCPQTICGCIHSKFKADEAVAKENAEGYNNLVNTY